MHGNTKQRLFLSVIQHKGSILLPVPQSMCLIAHRLTSPQIFLLPFLDIFACLTHIKMPAFFRRLHSFRLTLLLGLIASHVRFQRHWHIRQCIFTRVLDDGMYFLNTLWCLDQIIDWLLYSWKGTGSSNYTTSFSTGMHANTYTYGIDRWFLWLVWMVGSHHHFHCSGCLVCVFHFLHVRSTIKYQRKWKVPGACHWVSSIYQTKWCIPHRPKSNLLLLLNWSWARNTTSFSRSCCSLHYKPSTWRVSSLLAR